MFNIVILEKGCENQANKCCGLLTGRNSQFSSDPETTKAVSKKFGFNFLNLKFKLER